jgi:hypothetical protein
MAIGAGLAQLDGYPFEVRYSSGALERAQAAAEIAADAYVYFQRLLGGVGPDLALIIADRADWHSRQPYGLPFFNDDAGQIRPGILVMPAGSGEFWIGMADDLRPASPRAYGRILAAYPDGNGGVDLHPFFDLITLHELGHAFEFAGELNLPTFWLGEIFANLALHVFVATRRPDRLETLEVLPQVGAASRSLAARMRSEGYSTLEDLERHYTGGDTPMDPLNYVWYPYRWQRIAAAMFRADGEDSLVRFWSYFRRPERVAADDVTAATLAPVLRAEVSDTLGQAIQEWE